jgi:ribosome-associated protein
VTNDALDSDNPWDLPLGPFGLLPAIAVPEGGHLKLAAVRSVPTPQLPAALERACLSARVAADNKARDVMVLDMRGITPLYDFFVIATGNSRRQIHTIAEEVDAALRAAGDRRLAIEGYQASKWVVQDYGDVVVHVFDADTREYYALEELWADAPRVDWEQHV